MGKIVDGIYYGSDNMPAHRGIVKLDGNFYYAEKDGIIVKDRDKIVHREMAHNLVPSGTYYFDEEGKLVPDSYVKPNKRKKRIITRLRANKRIKHISSAIATILVLVFVVILATNPNIFNFNRNNQNNLGSSNDNSGIVLPNFNEDVYLCSGVMQKFYEGEITLEQAVKLISNPYSPFVFEYKLPDNYRGLLTLSEDKEYSNPQKYVLNFESTTLTIDNLKTDKQYFYSVEITDSDDNVTTSDGTFKTADTNRFISIPGLYNTRDIGGYNTLYGKKTKQGLLIRGTEIDGLVENKYFLKDKEDVRQFNFVCDLDLRSNTIINANYKSRLGDDVTHKFYDSPMYGGIFANESAPLLKEIFTDLADKNNYPMYLHCTYGADRTGTIIFLLQGLLGVSEEDMKNEYKLTGFFSHPYAQGTNLNGIYGGIEGVKGNTVNEKIENYFVESIGITKAQIQTIRDIFLD